MIKIIKNTKDFEGLEFYWNYLYEENNTYTSFQSFSYNYISWLRLLKNEYLLFIIVYSLKQEEYPCAIFPFCIDKTKCLRFLNEEHSDYQTALIKESDRTNLNMYKEIFEIIKNQPNINRVFLNHIRHDDLLLPYLNYINNYAHVYSTESYSYLQIKPSKDKTNFIDSFLHLSAKERNRLKNIAKKAESLSFKNISIADTEYPEEEILHLVKKMIDMNIRSSSYFTPNLLLFIKDLYNKGILEIGIGYHKNTVVSASFFYKCKNRTSIQWIIIYSDKTYNLQAKIKILDLFYKNGGGCFNFGRGTYNYKIQHFRPIIQNLYCVDIPFTRKARLMLSFKAVIVFFNKILYNIRKIRI